MSDLIRREDVIKLVNQFVFGLSKEQNDEVRRTFNKYIEKIPTAYSVDKVIKELEKANQGCCNYCGCDLYSDDIIELNMENLMITLIKDKKIPKRTSFLEKNFIYLYKLGFCFDFEGDVIMYNSYNDTFSLQLQKQYGE